MKFTAITLLVAGLTAVVSAQEIPQCGQLCIAEVIQKKVFTCSVNPPTLECLCASNPALDYLDTCAGSKCSANDAKTFTDMLDLACGTFMTTTTKATGTATGTTSANTSRRTTTVVGPPSNTTVKAGTTTTKVTVTATTTTTTGGNFTLTTGTASATRNATTSAQTTTTTSSAGGAGSVVVGGGAIGGIGGVVLAMAVAVFLG
ncbi:hypothetical protein DFH27DRAFT_579175 [Peziza echinospora]|nr:hypothetical protein DFH27DRAFT_579175 [Peziza echinospora]